MKRIKLTRGQYALVDDADYDWLNQHRWYARKTRLGDFYAYRSILSDLGAKDKLSMHRQILGLEPEDPRQGDHRDHNTLDNRRYNLRICTKAENRRNRGLTRRSTSSQFKSVSWDKQNHTWRAQITVNGKGKHLGNFTKEKYAAQAYNLAAKRYHKEFAFLNKIA